MYDLKACFRGRVDYQHIVQKKKKCVCGWQWWEVDTRKLLQAFWETDFESWEWQQEARVGGTMMCVWGKVGGENERELGVKERGGLSCSYSGVTAENGSGVHVVMQQPLNYTNQIMRIILYFWQASAKHYYKVVEKNLLDRKHFEYIITKISL